jgi:hypothetical protein
MLAAEAGIDPEDIRKVLQELISLHIALDVMPPATDARALSQSEGSTAFVRHTHVHEDLLVFTRQSGMTDAGETSDG